MQMQGWKTITKQIQSWNDNWHCVEALNRSVNRSPIFKTNKQTDEKLVIRDYLIKFEGKCGRLWKVWVINLNGITIFSSSTATIWFRRHVIDSLSTLTSTSSKTSRRWGKVSKRRRKCENIAKNNSSSLSFHDCINRRVLFLASSFLVMRIEFVLNAPRQTRGKFLSYCR